jgi:D-aspartate ligase
LKAGLRAGTLPSVALFDNYWAPTLAFASSLGRRGVPVHVYGVGASRWSRYCTRHYACPPVENADQFLPWLRERVRSGEIVRVAPTTDLIAYYVSSLRDEFPPEVRRTIPPLAEIERALIKCRFADACAAIGQSVPLMRTPTDLESALAAAGELSYPLILKPKSHLVVGTDERGYLIHDENELRIRFTPYAPAPGQALLAERYPELRWPLLQRYVPSASQHVYSVTGLKDVDHGIVTASLSYKREQWPPDTGTSTVQISSQEQAILAASLRAADQLVTCGIFELEILNDKSGLLAIDLNPRAFGFINLDIALGHDLPWLWLRSTIEPVTPQTVHPPRVVLEARHVLLHFLRRLINRRTHPPSPPTLERRDPERNRGWISILGNSSDPLPMLVSYTRLLRHPRSLFRTFMSISRSERARPDPTLPRAEGPQPNPQTPQTRPEHATIDKY